MNYLQIKGTFLQINNIESSSCKKKKKEIKSTDVFRFLIWKITIYKLQFSNKIFNVKFLNGPFHKNIVWHLICPQSEKCWRLLSSQSIMIPSAETKNKREWQSPESSLVWFQLGSNVVNPVDFFNYLPCFFTEWHGEQQK